MSDGEPAARRGIRPPAVAVVRGLVGAVLLVRPTVPLAVPSGPADRSARVVARLLGARHLVQAVVETTTPQLLTPGRSAFVDVTHAASMLGWALLDRPHRPTAMLNAGTAAAFAAAEVARSRG